MLTFILHVHLTDGIHSYKSDYNYNGCDILSTISSGYCHERSTKLPGDDSTCPGDRRTCPGKSGPETNTYRWENRKVHTSGCPQWVVLRSFIGEGGLLFSFWYDLLRWIKSWKKSSCMHTGNIPTSAQFKFFDYICLYVCFSFDF